MAKKPSGLGRGLGDLLEDNSLEVRNRGNVVLRGDAKASVIRAVVREDLSGAPGQSLDCGKKEIIVACGKYALQILEIAPSGSKAMPAAAFRNGLRGEKAEFIPLV